MNDLAFLFFQFEVRNLESPHSVQRRDERLVGVVRAADVPQILPNLPQGTEDPSPIKPLTFTVFAVIRHRICTSDPRLQRQHPVALEEEAIQCEPKRVPRDSSAVAQLCSRPPGC